MKRCTKCKETKGLEKFGKNKNAKNGLNCWCKKCQAENAHKNREARKDRQAKEQPLTQSQMSMMKKKCSKCNGVKALDSFGVNVGSKDGFNCWCKACKRQYARCEYNANKEKHSIKKQNWRKKNPERARAIGRETRERAGRFKLSLISSRSAAKRNGYFPCDATAEELEAVFDGKCRVCGCPEIECSGKLHMDHDHLRKTENFRGYLCTKCNKALGLLGDSEEVIINLLHYLMNGVKQE